MRQRAAVIKTGARFFANRASMAAAQEGYRAAAKVAVSDVATELRKLPRIAHLLASSGRIADHPTGYSDAILESLNELTVKFRPYRVDSAKFRAHVRGFGYPRGYAAGPLEEGGNRENKLLEYFLSLEILNIQPGDVVIDVASEYSIFPTVLRELYSAKVFRQDLIYPSGIRGDRIGGNAAAMPVSENFADVLVLHNSFEHFEGTADSEFIRESWRVLRPGGTVIIVPLFVSDRYSIVTDPLNERKGISWDPGARVVELPGWHNRFGRFYDASALESRVLVPAREVGYDAEILHFVNVRDVHPMASAHFALVMRKPGAAPTAEPGSQSGD